MLTFAVKKKRTPSIAPKHHAPTVSPMYHSLHLQQAKVRHILRSLTFQPKLTIGQPNDKYEQEADRVADEVMRMPEPGLQRQVEPEEEEEEETLQPKPLASQITPLVQVQRQEEPEEEEEETLQAKPLTEQITPLVQRQVEPEEEEEEEAIQTKLADGIQVQRQEEPEEEEELIQPKSNTGMAPQVAPGVAHDIHSFKGTGQPLSASERAFFEPRFSADFGDVRVHSDARAAHIARSVNARAFTLGRDVVFGARQYSPGTSSGRKLLAHELTHVVQQNGGSYAKQKTAPFHIPQIINKTGKNYISKYDRHKTMTDSSNRKVKVTQYVIPGKCKTRAIPESEVTAGITATKAFFEFKYCKGNFAAEGVGSLKYLGGLIDKILAGKNKEENFQKLQESLKKAGPLAGMSLTIRFHSFLAKFEGSGKAGIDKSLKGEVTGILRYTKGKFRIEGIAQHKGLMDQIKKIKITTLRLNTDIGLVEIRFTGGMVSEETTGGKTKNYIFQGKIQYRLSPGGIAPGVGVEYRKQYLPSGMSIDQIVFTVGIEYGGSIPKVEKPDCFKCSCSDPQKAYVCELIKPEPKKPKPQERYIYPVFYEYALAKDQKGKAVQNKQMVKKAVDKISEGYYVERIEGRTSPEGPLKQKTGSKFEGNINLAKLRAEVAKAKLIKEVKARLIKAVKNHPLNSILRMRQNEYLQNEYLQEVLKTTFPVEGTAPKDGKSSAELFGATPQGTEVKERNMFKHLLKELAKPKEGEPDKLSQEHVIDKNLPPDIKKHIEAEVEAFRSGKRGKVTLGKKSRLQTVYRLFRRALIFLKRRPKKLKKSDLFPKKLSAIHCDAEHKNIFKNVPIPDSWKTEGKCFEKTEGSSK